MPAITPGYLYTFFALIAISSILTVSFMNYAGVIRYSSEIRRLKNLMDYVAAKTTELLTIAETANATAEAFVQAPTMIGDKQYWLRLRNDSSRAWLEGGFGNKPAEDAHLRVYLQGMVSASGFYIGGYGAIRLKCFISAKTPHVLLSSSSVGGQL
ncbi:MAG: hypothetical protein RMJ15_02220 [Nitrososphaerota archaeon]|nr:hypothetical protein [Candidatus Bathyarchaeota archaeon]MDW8022549.1 hypothetical protein [Nitrososphaerota archaeon]